MELYAEIMAHYLSEENAQIIFPNLKMDAKEITEMQCYQALRRIKEILQDDSLEDDECFVRIEEIVSTMEELGIHCGNRHDFG